MRDWALKPAWCGTSQVLVSRTVLYVWFNCGQKSFAGGSMLSVCFKPSSICQINTSFVYTVSTGTSAQKLLACRAHWAHFSRVSTNSPQTWKLLFRQALKWLYFSVHVWGHGGNRFSRTSGIYDGWVKRRERERERVEKRVMNEKQF